MDAFVSIDPGNTTGWAQWENRTLVALGETYTRFGDTSMVLPTSDIAVVEMPLYYPHGRNKGDPNILIRLGWIAGAICARYAGTVLVEPREWRKGTAPKEVVEARTLARLSDSERAIAGTCLTRGRHAIDAVGIGLWALGR